MSIAWTPSDDQLKAVQGMVGAPSFGALAKPGFGKTSTTLAAYSVLKDAGEARAVLVVAPLRPTYLVWPAEVSKWLDFENLSVEILHGKDKNEALRRKADLYCINYDGLPWLERELAQLKKEGREIPFDVLCLDESTKIKNTNTQRYKTLKRLRLLFKRCWILTGTPAPNGIQDLFGQIFMLDLGQRLGRFITHFRRQYFHEYPQRGGYSLWEPRRGADKEIMQKISDIVVTFDAPPKTELTKNIIEVQLSPAAMRIYRELEDDFYAEVADGAVTAANAAAKSVKLRQITGGGVYGTAGMADVDSAKIDALLDLIEEQAGNPLLVAVAFKHEVERISKAMGYEVPYLGGGISPKESARLEAEWNAGKIPVLLAHPDSMALGLNLQDGGHTFCWFSLTWKAQEYEQSMDRIWRQGQKKGVVVHYLIAKDTIDARVLAALDGKTSIQNAIMSGLKAKRNQ